VTERNGREPAVIEHGRYRMYEAPDGLVLARAVDTCERCQGCGCGEQVEPLALPDPRKGRMHMLAWMAANANKGLMGALGKVMASGE
jgi:hypothetical protein